METINQLTEKIIGAAVEVHREKGPGLLESTYESCLVYELGLRGLKVERQVTVPLNCKGVMIDGVTRVMNDRPPSVPSATSVLKAQEAGR